MNTCTEKRYTALRCGVAALFALLSAAALSSTFRVIDGSLAERVAGNIFTSVPRYLLTAVILFALYAAILCKKPLACGPLCVAFSLLFGIANVLGRSMHALDSLDYLFIDLAASALTLVCFFGFAALFFFLSQWISVLTVAIGRGSASGFFGKNVFFRAGLVLLAAYLPWIIAFYPGCTVADVYVQLDFYFNGACSYAPVFSSMVTGLCVQIGEMFGSAKLGLFLFFVIQITVCVVAYASVLDAMARFRLHRALLWGTLAYYALLPVFPAYAMIASKDPIFSAFLLLFLSRAAVLLHDRGERLPLLDMLLLAGAALGSALFRNGAVWLILAGAAVVLVSLRKRLRLPVLAAVGCAALLFFVWDGVLLPMKNIPEAPRSESLSIPFQQTARCVAEHGDALTQEERSVIDAVLDYAVLADVYEPLLSDNVKSTYRLHGSPEEDAHLQAFFELWRTLILRYPATCLEALVGNSYGYYAFTPPTRTLEYNQNNGMCLFLQTSPYGTEHYPQWDFSMLPMLSGMRSVLRNVAEGFGKIPLLGLLHDCAFHCWFVVALLLERGRRKHLGIFVPILLLMLACIASPVNDCFRYFFAVAAASPLLLAVISKNADAEEQ